MNFNKLTSTKRQTELSDKAWAYVGNTGTRPSKRKTISNGTDVEEDDNDSPEELAPKKGRLSQNSGVSNPRVSAVMPGLATSRTSLGNDDTPALKMGRSTQIDGAGLSLSRQQASIPCVPLASGSSSSRASLGSIGDATSPMGPSVETEVPTSDMGMDGTIEVHDSNEELENTDSDTEEAQQNKLGK